MQIKQWNTWKKQRQGRNRLPSGGVSRGRLGGGGNQLLLEAILAKKKKEETREEDEAVC